MSRKLKFCPACQKNKSVELFGANPRYEDGKHPVCKKCSTSKKDKRKTGRPPNTPKTTYGGSKPCHLNYSRSYPNMGYTRKVSVEEYLEKKGKKGEK